MVFFSSCRADRGYVRLALRAQAVVGVSLANLQSMAKSWPPLRWGWQGTTRLAMHACKLLHLAALVVFFALPVHEAPSMSAIICPPSHTSIPPFLWPCLLPWDRPCWPPLQRSKPWHAFCWCTSDTCGQWLHVCRPPDLASSSFAGLSHTLQQLRTKLLQSLGLDGKCGLDKVPVTP
jgi:hypothetical protein